MRVSRPFVVSGTLPASMTTAVGATVLLAALLTPAVAVEPLAEPALVAADAIAAVEPRLVLMRTDGSYALAGLDRRGKLVTAGQGKIGSRAWLHVVAVGKHLLFLDEEGNYQVMRASRGGKLTLTDKSRAPMAFAWSHVTPVGDDIFFTAADGHFRVAHIDPKGKLVTTQRGRGLLPNWTHVMAVGSDLLFVRDDGHWAVAEIVGTGQIETIAAGNNTPAPWRSPVVVGTYVVFVRPEGTFGLAAVGRGGHLLTENTRVPVTGKFRHAVAVGDAAAFLEDSGRTTIVRPEEKVVVENFLDSDWTRAVGVGDKLVLVRHDGGWAVMEVTTRSRLRVLATGKDAGADWALVRVLT